MDEYRSAEIVEDSTGKQYHIGLRKEEVADYIMLVGDQARAKLVASLFDTVLHSGQYREYVTFTGIYKGIKLSVMATGMGPDNTEIAVVELCQLRFPLTIIRCGTCGGLQEDMDIGDLVISQGSVRLENTSTYYVEEGYPAVASHEIVLALLKAADQNKFNYHLGITATAPGFYGAQGRNVPGFPVRDEGLVDRLVKQGVKNLQMETSALLTLATFRGFRAGAVCVVFANRGANKFIKPDEKKDAELKAVKTTLRAFEILNIMDGQKAGKPYWLPKV